MDVTVPVLAVAAVPSMLLMAALVSVMAAVVATRGVRPPMACPAPMGRGDRPGHSRAGRDCGSDDPRDRDRSHGRRACERGEQCGLRMPCPVYVAGVMERIGQRRHVPADRA
jgi:hypothetical protein